MPYDWVGHLVNYLTRALKGLFSENPPSWDE